MAAAIAARPAERLLKALELVLPSDQWRVEMPRDRLRRRVERHQHENRSLRPRRRAPHAHRARPRRRPDAQCRPASSVRPRNGRRPDPSPEASTRPVSTATLTSPASGQLDAARTARRRSSSAEAGRPKVPTIPAPAGAARLGGCSRQLRPGPRLCPIFRPPTSGSASPDAAKERDHDRQVTPRRRAGATRRGRGGGLSAGSCLRIRW